MKKSVLILTFLFALLCVGSAWAGLMDKDVFIVGTESTYPPYESRNEQGDLIGFDIELMEVIAAKLGKKLDWQDIAFDALIPTLIAKRIDLIIAGMSITEERAQRVAFTEPYEISVSAFITKEDSNIKDTAALKGKSVATQIGTVQETYAHEIEGVEVKTFQKFDDCAREVLLGRVDAALMDIPVAKEFVSQKDFAGKIKVAFEQVITEGGKAIALNLSDKDVAEKMSRIIEELEKSGEMQKLRDKWGM
ncbi:MAG: transporter substrate-binding domain-containing protein [Synergistaceae bacterium]|nr:transporter substrate-binding domain-containing protein [Synergistaceae bacterium]